MRNKLFIFSLLVLALAFPGAARADGIIVPNPPVCDPCPPPPCPWPRPCPPPSPMQQLVIRYHRVQVTIQDQVALTHVDQVFYNPNEWAVEGTYLFPLPEGAAVSGFTLWVDGQPLQGDILDAEQARQRYQEIVRSLRDPALLEYADRGALQAHIFPIPPQGERRIELEYSQPLAAENGLVRYVYPLNTEKFSLWPLENVSIQVDIRSSSPIRAVYSPSHSVALDRLDENHVKAGYEAKDLLPQADFALYYSLGEEQAFHLLTYRDPTDSQDPDGFFLLLLAPRPETAQQTLPKDVILVLDRSGSMEGEKFRQAQDALLYILRHLNSQDHFNVITFSTGVDSYASDLVPASQASQAESWVESLSAMGSTDINRALLEAAGTLPRGQENRPAYVIFLTDGLPTEGEVDSAKILDNLASAAPADLRLFTFGVGYDVDTFLLDSLSQAHHGTSTYVLPSERLDETLSAFYARISTPVLTDLSLDFTDLSVYDLYPDPLPDLFSGSQIIVVGRYRQGGAATVVLRGQVSGQTQTFRFPDKQFSQASTADGALSSLPRIWATRKIGHLLNRIRLQGPDQETIDQVVRLSIRYGIVTPYTSYLVTEPLPLGAAEQQRIADQALEQLRSAPAEPSFGQAAVEKAQDQGALAGAEAPAPQAGQAAEKVRIVGSHTFVLSGEQWVDTAFDPQKMKTQKVAFLSQDYFDLLQVRPQLAAAFALGPQVIALVDGVAYEVLPSDAQVEALVLPSTVTPAPVVNTTTPATSGLPGATPTAQTEPLQPTPRSGLPCLGGLLPALLVPFGLLWARRRVGRPPGRG